VYSPAFSDTVTTGRSLSAKAGTCTRSPPPQGPVQPQATPVVSDYDSLAPGLLCIHGIAPHATEHVCALPSPSPLPLVPEVLGDIGLKRFLCRGAREGVGVPVTQHEAGNRERLGKRDGRDGGGSAPKSKREFGVQSYHAS